MSFSTLSNAIFLPGERLSLYFTYNKVNRVSEWNENDAQETGKQIELTLGVTGHECPASNLIANLGLGAKNRTFVRVT